MCIYSKDFLLENPFRVEYCVEEVKQGYFIELRKYCNGALTETEKCYVGDIGKEECIAILERLYVNGVTPVHLSCILEDVF